MRVTIIERSSGGHVGVRPRKSVSSARAKMGSCTNTGPPRRCATRRSSSESATSRVQCNRARVLAAGRPLLVAAQHTHEVRDDLTVEQILDMIIAIASIQGDTRYLEPILQTALDGLRPSTDVEPA
jgi:hypothetical protein